MNRDSRETLSTADLAGVAEDRQARRQSTEDMQRAEAMKRDPRAGNPDARAAANADAHAHRNAEAQAHSNAAASENLAPLFSPDQANDFRHRWDQIQFSFVDDPKSAVREGDELVAQVMKCLATSFSQERTRLEQELSQSGAGSTENLRMALRRYRSFFHRLLSLQEAHR